MNMVKTSFTSASIFRNTVGRILGIDTYTSQLGSFLFLSKIIILLVLVLYTHKVLGLGTKATVAVAALVYMVFFMDFWVFGTLWAIGLTIIAFLLVGILGFIS